MMDKEHNRQEKSGVVKADYQVAMDDGMWIDLDPCMQLNPAFNVKPGDRITVIVLNEDKDPVPLTPELLEQNGFERGPSTSLTSAFTWTLEKYKDDIRESSHKLYSIKAFQTVFRGMFISIVNSSSREIICFGKQMEFVHELQQALRFCEIDKEITIKKD